MKKSMSSFLKRILAVALAMFMVFTSMPLVMPVSFHAALGLLPIIFVSDHGTHLTLF